MVKKYGPGEFFGELALLYNAPRAASIYAKADDCIVYMLDRETFNNIVKEASIKKRNKYVSFLSSVEILKTLNSSEIDAIVDAIKEEKLDTEKEIIKQGELGDKFYILEEGEAVAVKTFQNGNIEEVYHYKEGGYFGELALMKDEPRAATVKTKTKCTILSLDRDSFKRLLGPLEDSLKKKFEIYQRYSNLKSS